MLNLMFLAATAMAGDLDARPLMMVDGQIVVGPTIREILDSQDIKVGKESGRYFLGDLYQNWLNDMGEPERSDMRGVISTGLKVLSDREGMGGVYACTCPDMCSSEECEYMIEMNFGGFDPVVVCSGMCKDKDSCNSDFQSSVDGQTNETETETSGQTKTESSQSSCSTYSCEEEVMFPSNPNYHSWVMEMLSRQE